MKENMLQEVTPMMQHYLQTKEENKDCILFYRLGDFYEMFFEDAKIVSKELEHSMTAIMEAVIDFGSWGSMPLVNNLFLRSLLLKKASCDLNTSTFLSEMPSSMAKQDILSAEKNGLE